MLYLIWNHPRQLEPAQVTPGQKSTQFHYSINYQGYLVLTCKCKLNSSICPLPFPLQLSSTRNSHQLFNSERSYLNYLTLNFLICKIKIIIEPNVVVFLCTICKSQMLAYNKLWHTMLELYLVFIYLSLLTKEIQFWERSQEPFEKYSFLKTCLYFCFFFFKGKSYSTLLSQQK